MTNNSLQSQVQRLRANIQANHTAMRAELHRTLHEGQTRRLQAERSRRAAARQAAEQRHAERRQLQEDVRVKLEVDMEMLHIAVETGRQERLAQRLRTAWHGRAAMSARPHMPVSAADTINLSPAASTQYAVGEAHAQADEPTEAAQNEAPKAQARRKSAKSSTDIPEAVSTTGAGEEKD